MRAYGRIMLQRFEVPVDPLGNPGAPVAGGIDGVRGLDNVFGTGERPSRSGRGRYRHWQVPLDATHRRAALHGFETAVIWIDPTAPAASAWPGGPTTTSVRSYRSPEFANISGAFPVAAGTNAYIVQAGAVNLGIAWITPDASEPERLPGDGHHVQTAGGLNGVGFGLVAPGHPSCSSSCRFRSRTPDFHLPGISGEDSDDLVVSWNDGGDVKGAHIRVTLDPATGVALIADP